MASVEIDDAVLAELRRLRSDATQGEAYVSGQPWFSHGDLLLFGSPDPHAGQIVADFSMLGERPIAKAESDAAFTAECINLVLDILSRTPGASDERA